MSDTPSASVVTRETMPALIARYAVGARLGLLLALCLVLGGTSQEIVLPRLVIHMASVLCLGLAMAQDTRPLTRPDGPVMLAGAFIVLNLIYLLPLPPEIWTQLPGRESLIRTYREIGMDLPFLSLSMTPERTIFSLLDLLAPIAVYLTVAVAGPLERTIALWTIIGVAVASVVLGAMQMSGADALYLYEVTNRGRPVGFFSNINHQATLLLMALPLAISRLPARGQLVSGLPAMSKILIVAMASSLLAIIIGLLINTSVTGYFLLPLMLAGSGVILLMDRRFGLPSLLLVGVAFLAFFVSDMFTKSGILPELFASLTSSEITSRPRILQLSVPAMMDFMPFGSGLGSFPYIYSLYESPAEIDYRFVPHAHNEYLEMALELGLPGLAFMGWLIWIWAVRLIRSAKASGQAGRVQALAGLSLLALGLHSIIDFPARTIAIAALAAFCLALMRPLAGDTQRDERAT